MKKTVFLLAVCAAGFVCLELALYASGTYLLWQRRANRSPGKARIVCFGDSHTFGVGTAQKYSYPGQLETLLKLNNPSGPGFSVSNFGIPGSSTRRQAEEIKRFFADGGKAELVLLLTGRNNDREVEIWQAHPGRPPGWDWRQARSARFLEELWERLLGSAQQAHSSPPAGREGAFQDYISFYLEQALGACRANGATLILLSYYTGDEAAVREFGRRRGIACFDPSGEFQILFASAGREKFVSPDFSHLNRLGYAFYAQRLYEELFRIQPVRGAVIAPMVRVIPESEYYGSAREKEEQINAQKERLEKSRGTPEYPFELVHLGHIYAEAGDREAARDCYQRALEAADYADNNTTTAPAVNWYLRQGRKDEARALCEDILRHNPANGVASSYLQWIRDNR